MIKKGSSTLPRDNFSNLTYYNDANYFESVSAVFNGKKPKQKGITKTFRLDEDVTSKLEQEAKRNNICLNAIVNNALRSYVTWDLLAPKAGILPISRSVIREILQGFMSKEEVVKLATNVGITAVRELAYFMQGQLTIESFLSWFKTTMSYCSAISYKIESNDGLGKIQILFRHDVGENWSLYNRIIVERILNEILGGDDFEIETSNTTLIIRFKWVI